MEDTESIVPFLETLKELMEDRGLNIAGLSAAVSCDQSAIRRWFGEMYYPEPETLIRLADLFGCSVDYLFGLTDVAEFAPACDGRSFYGRFCELKRALGVSDYRVARECGLRKSTVSKWREVKSPETVSLLRLASFFNCSLEFLLGRSKE